MKEYYNEDAEKNVLGAILIDRDNFTAINTAKNILNPQDFYDQRNKYIYTAMLEMYEKKDIINATNLCAYLNNKDKDKFSNIGGILYITQLGSYTPSSLVVKNNAEYVKQEALRRALRNVALKINDYCSDDDIYEGIHQAKLDLLNIDVFKDESLPNPADDVMAAYQDIEERVERKTNGKQSGILTGFTDLDNITGGLQPSNFIVLAARPSVGKTAFSLGIASKIVLKDNKPTDIPVAFFSLEMGKNEIYNRLFCIKNLIDCNKIRNATLNNNDWLKIQSVAEMYSKANLYIDDTSRLTITELRNKVTKLKAQKDIKLVIIDYLQLMTSESNGRQENREREIGRISRELKILAKELNIVILALSQMNRDIEKRNGVPVLSDIRESGTIEQDADIVMFLYKKKTSENNPNDDNEKNIVHLKIAKHRNGALKDIPLFFHSQFCRFENLAKDYVLNWNK